MDYLFTYAERTECRLCITIYDPIVNFFAQHYAKDLGIGVLYLYHYMLS